MSSISAAFKQPLTRSFVNTQNPIGDETGPGPRLFLESDFVAWLSANAGLIQMLGSLYIIPGTTSGTTMIDVLRGDGGATALNYSGGELNNRKTLRDLGTEIIIGNRVDSRLVVFRRVASYFTSSLGQDAEVGYVVVENNCADLDNNGGRFQVRVARI